MPAPIVTSRVSTHGNDWLSREELASLTPQELVARTTVLKPLLAKHAQACEEMRHPVDEVWNAIRKTGVFYHFIPKRFGGLEFDVDSYIDAMLPLAEGCASTAWAASFCVEHNWMAALLPEEGQAVIFGKFPYIIAPTVGNPPGVATKVDGGYRLTGHWKWGTGVMHADWIMACATVAGMDPSPVLLFVFPVEQCQILDVWQVDGMAGTGSNDIKVADIFVPDSHVTDFGKMREGTAIGGTVHANPLYRMPMYPFLAVAASLSAIGSARSAVNYFRERIGGRMAHGTQVKQEEKQSAQVRLAHADLMTRNAEMLLRDVARRTFALADVPGPKTEGRIELRAQAAYAVHMCKAAVRLLIDASGASVHFLNNPLQRAMRDVQVISGHAIYDPDSAYELKGRLMIGLPPNSTSL